MSVSATAIERTARKDHRCAVQAYYDRLKTTEKRDWYGAVPCPEGGVIRVGARYLEDEGDDQFHPSRRHIGCKELLG